LGALFVSTRFESCRLLSALKPLKSLHTPTILVFMQSASQPPPESAPEPSSFAGFLSALTSTAPASRGTEWNDDALAADVATLSYESALKTHSRYEQAPDPDPQFCAQAEQVSAARRPAADAESSRGAVPRGPQPSALNNGDLKSASVTIRMSPAECAQLRQRAAEAGMTISAYLRSCTFEAESLRRQVKEALAQLHSASSQPTSEISNVTTRRWWQLWFHARAN
jgi:hypothetical protein